MSFIATAEMANYCLHVIAALAHDRKPPNPPSSIPDIEAPIFVTLHKDGDLRGCIGTFSPAPLREQLMNYSEAAAFEDSRFEPVQPPELPSLICDVSLLHSFEQCKAWDDWSVGTHGIRIEFGKHYNGTYLPCVAEEQQWDHETTIKSLIRKAGYRSKITPEIMSSMRVERYQVSKATSTERVS